MADFRPFDLGAVLQTAESIKAMRSQAKTDRLREQYLGEQIQGMRDDRARQRRQDQIVLGKEKAQQVVAKTGQILQAQNPKNYIEQFEPDLVKNLAANGVDWSSVDDNVVRQMVTAMQNKANQELGVAPIQEQQVGGFRTLQQGGKVIASSAPAQAKPDAVTERWKQEVQNGYQGSLLDYQKELKAAGRPQVTVNSKQETEESKAIGRELGKQYASIQEAGVAAAAKVNRYERMGQLLEGVRTGKLTPKMTEIAALADSLGIKLDPNIGEKQAVQALSNEVALQLRNPSGGAGMPGALSDQDRQFLVSMTPGLANTPEGNRLIIQSAIKLAKRDQEIAKMARAYRAENGTMEGFSEELAQWSAENPLFGNESAIAEAAQPSLTATGPNGEKLMLKNGQWVPMNGN